MRAVTAFPPAATAALVLLLGAGTLLAGCNATGSAGTSIGSPLGTENPGDTGLGPGDTIGPEDTGSPGIAGFEGWKTINGQDVEIGQTESGLAMTLTHRALWFQASKGVPLIQTFGEGITDIVTGRRPMSDFDGLVSAWKSGG